MKNKEIKSDNSVFLWRKNLMTQKERMKAGLIYDPADKEIMSDQAQGLELMYEFNLTRPCESEKRAELLNKMLGEIGEGCHIEPPFRANWVGKHICPIPVYASFGLKRPEKKMAKN